MEVQLFPPPMKDQETNIWMIAEYYIFFPNREYRIIHLLKRAAIERLFKLNPDSDIVDEYLSMSGNKDIYAEKELEAPDTIFKQVGS